MENNDGMSIRPAQLSDAACIARLSGELGYPTSLDAIAQRLSLLPAEFEQVVVACDDERVIGWMQVGLAMSIESEPFAEIRALVVDSSVRGQGWGKRLVDAAMDWSRSHGMARLRVRSNSLRIATHEFYRRQGFTESKQQKVFELAL